MEVLVWSEGGLLTWLVVSHMTVGRATAPGGRVFPLLVKDATMFAAVKIFALAFGCSCVQVCGQEVPIPSRGETYASFEPNAPKTRAAQHFLYPKKFPEGSSTSAITHRFR